MALDDKKLDQVTDDSNGVTDDIQSDSDDSAKGDTNSNNGSDSWELLINGKTQKFTEAELIENVQKGLDYTQKTQVLADETKRFQPYKDFADKMETNTEFRDAVIETVTEFESRESNQSTDSDPKIMAELNLLRQQISTLTMGTKFESLEKKYGKLVDRVEIAAYAGANKITDPETAFFMLNKDKLIEVAKNEGIKIGKKGGNDVLVTKGGTGIKAPKDVDTKNMSKTDKRTRAVKLFQSLKGT